MANIAKSNMQQQDGTLLQLFVNRGILLSEAATEKVEVAFTRRI